MTRDELIEEIELFGKLDIKYLLEELNKNSDTELTEPEPIPLDEEAAKLIQKALIVLVKEDHEFAQAVETALTEVDKKNQPADITITTVLISSGISFLVGYVVGKSRGDVYGAMQNDGDIDYHIHLDNMDSESLKSILKEYMEENDVS
jgi:hypothetical protein